MRHNPATAMPHRIAGFYAVLDADDEALARMLVCPVSQGGAGARVLQVRIKPTQPPPTALIMAAARMARRVTAEYGALLIVNDRLDIALAADADGVHLGQEDLPLPEARQIVQRMDLGRLFLVGVSTHSHDEIVAAVRGGADYIGFGPVFPTATKPEPDPVQGLDRLHEAVAAAEGIPVVAIGGITPDTASAVAAAGAVAACCISAVNHAENPVAAGARISAAFTRSS